MFLKSIAGQDVAGLVRQRAEAPASRAFRRVQALGAHVACQGKGPRLLLQNRPSGALRCPQGALWVPSGCPAGPGANPPTVKCLFEVQPPPGCVTGIPSLRSCGKSNKKACHLPGHAPSTGAGSGKGSSLPLQVKGKCISGVEGARANTQGGDLVSQQLINDLKPVSC